MLPVLLTKVKTRDGEILEGIVILPKKKSETALIWLHGLSSKFYSSQTLIKELSESCTKAGLGYFKFNNRGNNIVVRGEKGLLGAGFEKFTDCVLDIQAVIRLAKSLGYKNIILAGHSTGANKALYYVYKTKDRSIKKLILLGPISDIVEFTKEIGKKKLAQAVALAEKLKKKNPRLLMPQQYGLYTAERYLSLCKSGGAEDTFPYYNPHGNWKELKSVKIPLAVIVGGRDEYLDRPAKNLVKTFSEKAVNTKQFFGAIIKNALHGFQKKEKELSQEIIKFINGL